MTLGKKINVLNPFYSCRIMSQRTTWRQFSWSFGNMLYVFSGEKSCVEVAKKHSHLELQVAPLQSQWFRDSVDVTVRLIHTKHVYMCVE